MRHTGSALDMLHVPPTDRQRQILDWISAYIAHCGYSPTLREIGEAHGIGSNNGVADHLWPLRRRGLVTWVEGRARTIRVLEVGT